MVSGAVGLTGAIIWIVVIVAVLMMIKNSNNTLFKSRTNRKIFGVCGGVGEYFNVDPTIVRLLLVVIVLAGGSGILAYIIAAIVMPERPY